MSLLEKIVAEIGAVDEVAELVALLRSSQLPTVVVEDPSDVQIYSRWVERHLFGTYKVDILDAGGRDNLLNLYERRNEFADLPVVFVANRGMWLFLGTPKDYSDVVCTQGYSIENDVYAVSGVETLLDPTISWEHWLVREAIIRWFAFEVEEARDGMLPEVNMSLDTLVPKGNTEVDKTFRDHRGFHWPGTQITEEISDEYRFNLPGKLLFEMFARFSSIPLRGLYNVALADYESAPRKLIQEIREKLGRQNPVSTHKVLSGQKTARLVLPMQQIKNLVRNSKKKTEVNAPYSSADQLVANLKAYTPTVIIEREDDNRFDWWTEQLKKRLKPRKMNQLREHLESGVQPSVFEELIHKINQLREHLESGVQPSVFEELIHKINQLREHLESGVQPSVFEELIHKINQLDKHPKVLSIIRSDELLSLTFEELIHKINQLDKHPKVLSIIGRNELLSIYERRSEFVDVPVVFVGNREMWSFMRVPEDYEDIIWTRGYSLENDLYEEADLERLLEPHETWKHQQVRNSVIEWFAFEVEEFLAGRREKIDMNFELSDIVPEGELGLDKEFCQHLGFYLPPSKRVQQIKETYERRLPGKFLFQMLIRFLNIRGRDFNFNVTERSLYDIALTVRDSQLPLNALMEDIEAKLDTEEERIIKTKPIISQRQKVGSRKEYSGKSKRATKQLQKSGSKGKQASNPRSTQPSQLLRKSRVKVGGKVNATIQKKDSIKVTVQLQTDYKEVIDFEYSDYPGKIRDKVELRVINIDGTGRVLKVVPFGHKVNATIQKKDSIKVTVQLQTDYKEVIDFEYPYYPRKTGDEVTLKVMDIDSTGRISKVIP